MRFVPALFALSLASLSLSSFVSEAKAEDKPAAGAPATEGGPRTHDGFYLRLGAGYGYMSTSVDPSDSKIKGAGSAWLLTIGGTPIPGLVIGGTLFTHLQSSPTVEVGGQSATVDKTLFLLGLGPTVDFYPNPKEGLHVGGGLAYSTFNAVNYTSTGYGANVFGGYDLFFSDSWSVGPILQLAYSRTSKDLGGGVSEKDGALSISAMVTVVDH